MAAWSGRGLLVTHFWYIRFVNQQTLQHTGLTRDGLFLIENEKITTPEWVSASWKARCAC